MPQSTLNSQVFYENFLKALCPWVRRSLCKLSHNRTCNMTSLLYEKGQKQKLSLFSDNNF